MPKRDLELVLGRIRSCSSQKNSSHLTYSKLSQNHDRSWKRARLECWSFLALQMAVTEIADFKFGLEGRRIAAIYAQTWIQNKPVGV